MSVDYSIPRRRKHRFAKTHPISIKSPAKRLPISTQALVQAVVSPVATAPPSGRDDGTAQDSPPQPEHVEKTPTDYLPSDSIVRTKAMHILAMRMSGVPNAEIAKAVGIAERTVRQYIYLAGRHGWLSQSPHWADPTDRLEFELSHKVVRNLDAALDKEQHGDIGAHSVTLEVAKGVLFKKFGEMAGHAAGSLAVQIIVQPHGREPITAREGSVTGTPRFVEGDMVEPVNELEPARG